MCLTVISNPDPSQSVAYKIARVVYAETAGASLRVVEALCSMIENAARDSGRSAMDVASDADMFDALRPGTARNRCLGVDAQDRKFQMCLRVVKRMLNGNLADGCVGATRFHHDDVIPSWATSRGYIAEIDGLLFYL